jgi:Holliday junction resolvase RusA-like endonuclease
MSDKTIRRLDEMRTLKFIIPGEPKGKGRPRFIKTTGGTYTPKDTASYENLVKVCFMEAKPKDWVVNDQMCSMCIRVYFGIPKSTSKKKRKDMMVHEIRPTKKPDLDNIIKIISDALNGIAYKDDSQIVGCYISKWYSNEPRVEVEIAAEE